jgi:hypothetical protein
MVNSTWAIAKYMDDALDYFVLLSMAGTSKSPDWSRFSSDRVTARILPLVLPWQPDRDR